MNRWLLLLVLAGVAGCPRGGPPSTSVAEVDPGAPPPTRSELAGAEEVSAAERLTDAILLLETGHAGALVRAERLLTVVVADDPQGALGWFNLGVAQQRLNKLDPARRSYEQALSRDPGLAVAHLYVGLIHEAQERPDLAVATYRRAIEQFGDDMALRAALVGALRKQGTVDEAIEEAKAALRVNASSLPIYNELGLAWIEKGDLGLARFVFQKALNGIEGARESAPLHANLGRVYSLEGDEARSRYYLERAVELDPQSVPALVYLSRRYLDDHNHAGALPLLERALAQQPGNHGVLVNLGIAYRGVGRHDEARRAYEKALEVNPRDPTPHFDLGILLGDHLKQYDQGIASFKRYLDAGGPQQELARTYLAELEKERERAAKRSKAEEERRAREAERVARERLLEEATPAPAPSTNPWGENQP